jgi:hypothetical protein
MEAGRFDDGQLRKGGEHLRASRWSAISISAGATKKRNQELTGAAFSWKLPVIQEFLRSIHASRLVNWAKHLYL